MWLLIGEISTPIARAQKKHHSIVHVQLHWSGRAFECMDDNRTFHLSKNDKTPQCDRTAMDNKLSQELEDDSQI
jgi:hypothetical protein